MESEVLSTCPQRGRDYSVICFCQEHLQTWCPVAGRSPPEPVFCIESLEGIFCAGPTPARRWHELGTRWRRDLIKIWRGSCLCKLPTSCSRHKADGECDGLPWSPRVIVGIGKASRLRVRSRELIWMRSEEHTSELQSLMRISYAVFCLK